MPAMRYWLSLGFLALACLSWGGSQVEAPKPAKPERPPTLAERAAPKPIDIAELPEGFSENIIATGVTGATAMTVAPDGRVFVCEQTGALRVIKDDKLLAEPFVTLSVDSSWERGLIGVTLDPDFPGKPYVYLCYVAAEPYPHHRVSRFTAKGDVAAPDSEVVLLKGDDQTKLGGRIPNGHQGGGIHFGKDGKLYIAVGDQTAGAPAQKLDTLQGKLLRINPDGSLPEDNPFFKTAADKYRAIWALGLRNPFAFAVQPGTGRIFINDVGEARWEEINEGAAGANYGWPHVEGPSTNPKYRGPVYAYDRSLGKSITGGTFYNPPVGQFPREYLGKYFFAEYIDNWIRVLDPDNPKDGRVFATGLAGPVDVRVGPDGSLYVLNRNVWVKDGKFKPGTGSVHRIRYTPRSGKPAPLVTLQPGEQTVAVGQGTTFTVRADGEAPLTYQWQRNGVPIKGATASSYTLTAVKAADDGARFRCVVSNVHGSTKSKPAALWVARLRPPADPGPLVQGLNYAYFEGRWTAMPDFAALKPVRSGRVSQIDLTPRSREEHFGTLFQGWLEVTRDGAYTFSLKSSGASKLFVSSAEVAGTGLATAQRGASGSVGLKAGKHPFLLLYAHGRGRPHLEVSCAGPDMPQRMTPTAMFSCQERGVPVVPAITAKGGDPGGKAPYGLTRRDLVATPHVPPDPAELPPLLSQTGVFQSLTDLAPGPGIIPYEVNSPLWSDGAAKRRWIALPGDGRIAFAPTGEWKFPAGTVFIKHFERPTAGAPRRLETRLLVVDRTGFGYGVTYKWKPDQNDAELLADGLTEEISPSTSDGTRKLKWSYPSRNECLACHTANAGFVLGVKTRQLNGDLRYPGSGVTDNQLRTWNHLGMFQQTVPESDIPRYDKLASVTDPAASPEHRVRSYLDANCAQCHRPGGARGEFDNRWDTPLSRQKVINGPLVSSDLGVRQAKLVTPGDPSRSMLYLRMNRRQDVFDMPPLATHEVDAEAVAVVAEWIRSLPAAPPAAPPAFEKRVLTDKYYCDGVTTGDINRDDKTDVVAGPFWYEGPDFKTRHEFYPAQAFDPAPSPSNSMFSYLHDFNEDGWPDILVLGRVFHHEAYWYENPRGKEGHWKKHFAFRRVYGESPPFVDVDGDGRPELVAHWEGRWGFIRPNAKVPTEPWTFRPVTARGEWHHYYHGTGVGDVNGDGRLDLILNDGWWEQPAPSPLPLSPAAGERGRGEGAEQAEWTAHPFRFSEKGGAQMFAYDVDGDGDNDIITSLDAHGWGLAWFEQVKEEGKITFRKHPIMGDRSQLARYGVAFSQPHALALADIDGDGLKDIIVGKRRWAHGPKGDVEPNEAPVIYWFRLVRERGRPAAFVPHLVDENSGVGVQITAADVNGDGHTDILTASKLGTFVFLNREKRK